MPKTFYASLTLGVYKQVSSRWGTDYIADRYDRVGWGYTPTLYGNGWVYMTSHSAAALFSGTLPAAVEPAAADAPQISLTVTLEGALAMEVSVGVLTGAFGNTPSQMYAQMRNSSVIGTIPAGSTSGTFTLTRAQANDALAYGVAVFPTTELGTTDSERKLLADGTKIEYAENNPAARGQVSNLSPGEYSAIVGNEATVFGYTYRHADGGYRQAYLSVIAKNQDTGEVVTICRKSSVSVASGGRGTFTIPANTLGYGRWTLTICAAPAASAGYYADSSDFWTTGQSFTYNVRETPSAASVECDGKPIPALEWTATSQAAYQVRFGDYDSGARVGTTPAFTVPRIWPDGSYPVRVRSAVSSGDWSEWTETDYVTVANVEPEGDFAITAARQDDNIVISWGAFAAAEHYAVIRDGKMIAVLDPDARQYVDRFAAAGVYQILAVTADRYYKPSNRVAAALGASTDLLSTDGGYDWLRLRYTPEAKNQPESVRTDVTYAYYSGRHKPVAFTTGQRTRTKSFSYIFRKNDRETARALRDAEGLEVIVKTTRGEAIRGVLSEMSWGDARCPAVSFTVREIDGEEDHVEYPLTESE